MLLVWTYATGVVDYNVIEMSVWFDFELAYEQSGQLIGIIIILLLLSKYVVNAERIIICLCTERKQDSICYIVRLVGCPCLP